MLSCLPGLSPEFESHCDGLCSVFLIFVQNLMKACAWFFVVTAAVVGVVDHFGVCNKTKRSLVS